MPDSMYDRLGDLLSETLDAGKVKFVKVEKTHVPPAEEKVSEDASAFFEPQNESDPESFRANRESEKNAREEKEKRRLKKEQAEKSSYEAFGEYAAGNATIYKSYEYVRVPPEVEKALALLSLNINSTQEEFRKAYKDKLKAFHPDLHSGTQAGKRIAEEKTRQVVEAYRVLLEFWHY